MRQFPTISFKKIIAVVLYSNLFISLAAAAALETTVAASGARSISFLPHITLFLLTFSAYNFLRITTKQENLSRDKKIDLWIFKNRLLMIILSSAAIAVAAFISFKLPFWAILALFASGLLTLIYDIGKFGLPNLRSNPFTKVISVAAAWSVTTVIFPILALNIRMNNFHIILLFFQRFFFIAALAIPYDIADIERDIGNIRTIPLIIGDMNAKTLSYLMLVLCSLIVSLNSAIGFISPSISFIMFLTFVISGFIVKLFNPRNDTYLYLAIDGMLVVQSIFVIIISQI